MRRKSFTLIELLLVIAVIAILSGMLLPALARVKEMLKTTVCVNNTKQLLVGAYTYSNDYEGFAPDPLYVLGKLNGYADYYQVALTDKFNRYTTFNNFYQIMILGKYYDCKTLQCPVYPEKMGTSWLNLQNVVQISNTQLDHCYWSMYNFAPFETYSTRTGFSSPLRLGKYPRRPLIFDSWGNGGNGTYNMLAVHSMRGSATRQANGFPVMQSFGRTLIKGDVVCGDQDGSCRVIYDVSPYYNYSQWFLYPSNYYLRGEERKK